MRGKTTAGKERNKAGGEKSMKTAWCWPPGEDRCASVPVPLADKVNVDTWAVGCTSAWNTELLCTPWLGRSRAVGGTCEKTTEVHMRAFKTTTTTQEEKQRVELNRLTGVRMALTFGGWQVGVSRCTRDTSSSSDHNVWPQLSNLLQTHNSNCVTKWCLLTEKSDIFENEAAWICTSNCKDRQSSLRVFTAICRFLSYFCHNSIKQTTGVCDWN